MVKGCDMHKPCRPFGMDVMTIPQGTGSGFIWDKRGHVVTNYHVVKGASGGIKVTLIDSTTCSATIVGVDETKDIAVLKLDIPESQAARLLSVELGRSANLKVGQKVFAIGNPFGLDHTMTSVWHSRLVTRSDAFTIFIEVPRCREA